MRPCQGEATTHTDCIPIAGLSPRAPGRLPPTTGAANRSAGGEPADGSARGKPAVEGLAVRRREGAGGERQVLVHVAVCHGRFSAHAERSVAAHQPLVERLDQIVCLGSAAVAVDRLG